MKTVIFMDVILSYLGKLGNIKKFACAVVTHLAPLTPMWKSFLFHCGAIPLCMSPTATEAKILVQQL